MSKGWPSPKEVREYLEDFPFKNFKYEAEFFSDPDIRLGTKWAKERFEALPPVDAVNVNSLPKYISLMGIIAQLFKIKYLNASINYSPGIQENGINIPEGEDSGIFKELFRRFDEEFSRDAISYKQAVNIKGSLTSIRSPYSKGARRKQNNFIYG